MHRHALVRVVETSLSMIPDASTVSFWSASPPTSSRFDALERLFASTTATSSTQSAPRFTACRALASFSLCVGMYSTSSSPTGPS